MVDDERGPIDRASDASWDESPSYAEALGRAIQALRAERGISRAELAERAGLSYSYLSEIETGKKAGTSAKVLFVLAKALGLTVRELLSTAEERVLPTMAAHADRDALATQFTVRDFSTPEDRASLTEPLHRRRSWFRSEAPPEFHASRAIEPRDAPASGDARGPALRELSEILPRLAPEDLERVLDLARRLRR